MKGTKKIKLSENRIDKLIVIGDIHGLSTWCKVIKVHPDAACYVFLGDYCDPYGLEISDEMVVDNLIDIISFKKEYPERVILLLGNHDMHYLLPNSSKGSRYNRPLSMILYDLFKNNEVLFQPAYACGRLLFTHAGVLHSWFERFHGDFNESIAEQLNNRRGDSALLQCGFLRGGNDEHGGIFWADIDEFVTDDLLPGYIQLVGHNRVISIKVVGESTDTTGVIVFCDSLYRNNYLVVEHPSAKDCIYYEENLTKKR